MDVFIGRMRLMRLMRLMRFVYSMGFVDARDTLNCRAHCDHTGCFLEELALGSSLEDA